jgi:D-3-phosphoglycerate dehydrogenase
MKVLIADQFEQSGIAGLAECGCEVVYDPALKDDALAAALLDSRAEVLIVRSTKVTAEMMGGGDLALIVRAGAGYNTIDVAAASGRGIYVSNCPGKNAIAVAELTWGLILSLDRRIPDGVADLRKGVWNKSAYGKARGLFGRTLGIVGLGSIGREVALRARAFGMPMVAWSRSLTPEAAQPLGITSLPSPVEVAARADVVTVHLALKPETRELLGHDFFAAMRPGALFVNTARAEVVDESALAVAVRGKGVRAAVDVFNGEPTGGTGSVSSPLFQEPGLYGTHHIGASTEQAQDAIAEETVRIVLTFAASGRVPNCVNIARRTPATHLLMVRHLDRVGVLARVFGALKDASINAQQTENVVFDGAVAAVARIQLDREPSVATLTAIRAGGPDILELSVKPVNG